MFQIRMKKEKKKINFLLQNFLIYEIYGMHYFDLLLVLLLN